jgi:predicted nuclease with RNAse H fold
MGSPNLRRSDDGGLVAAPSPLTTIGIDVGGDRKGFHAVALRGGVYAGQLASRDVRELSHWCRAVMDARVIAIDAPCRWSLDGRPRPCERELLAQGIRCFTSPTREQAVAHPTNTFGWMLQGEALFQALEPTHPLLSSLPIAGPACFETFPHAITWHLRDGHAAAAQKQPQRRGLLEQEGIDPSRFTRIDWIDAALCALAAHQATTGVPCAAYGEPETGLIVVPRGGWDR